MAKRSKWLRSRLLRLVLVLAGLLLGLVLAEVTARLARPPGNADLLFDAPESTPRGLYLVHSELLMAPAPGFTGVVRSLDYSVPLRFNSLGLRGPEPTPGAAGWLTVGDSLTMALQVPEAQTFQARLQASLGQPVYNAGVDTYSTWQATRRYRQLAPRLGTRGVILVYFLGNDPLDNEGFHQQLMDLVTDVPDVKAGSPMPRPQISAVTRLLMAHSHLYGHLRVWYRQQTLKDGTHRAAARWRTELSLFTRGGESRLQRLMVVTERALQQLKEQTALRKDRLLVAVAPPAFVVEPRRAGPTLEMVGLDPRGADLDAPGRAVMALLARHKIAACDLAPALKRSAGAGQRPYFIYDGHWTEAGHRAAASALLGCLKRQGWR